MQVLTIVGPMILSGTAMIGGATWFLSARIERVRALASQVAEMSPKIADLSIRVASLEVRIGAVENLMSVLVRGGIQA